MGPSPSIRLAVKFLIDGGATAAHPSEAVPASANRNADTTATVGVEEPTIVEQATLPIGQDFGSEMREQRIRWGLVGTECTQAWCPADSDGLATIVGPVVSSALIFYPIQGGAFNRQQRE